MKVPSISPQQLIIFYFGAKEEGFIRWAIAHRMTLGSPCLLN